MVIDFASGIPAALGIGSTIAPRQVEAESWLSQLESLNLRVNGCYLPATKSPPTLVEEADNPELTAINVPQKNRYAYR